MLSRKPGGRGASTSICHIAPSDRDRSRVLIASHSHPSITKGGAEIAAYQIFSALSDHPAYQAWFLGCVRDDWHQKLGATFSQPFSGREYLYAAGAFDWFKFANLDPKFPDAFRALLLHLKPQVVHFHHFLNLGVESFLHVRKTLPACKIVLTLHEYLAICHHYGQMITKRNRTLCYQASPERCGVCFTDIGPSDFFLRTRYIKRFFDLVDIFIAPSRFLRERYIAWGIPADRLTVMENLIPQTKPVPEQIDRPNERDIMRVGFFGQISPLKGINVLFEAAAILAERENDIIVFEIYGDDAGQPAEFQADFREKLGGAGRNVKFQGAYEQCQVDALMQAVDLILVPSIWWENSPVVIQEAQRNRRPVVCSDIGGMAEKVNPGIDGFHFPVGNSIALAALLTRLAQAPECLREITTKMGALVPAKQTSESYNAFYTALIDAK